MPAEVETKTLLTYDWDTTNDGVSFTRFTNVLCDRHQNFLTQSSDDEFRGKDERSSGRPSHRILLIPYGDVLQSSFFVASIQMC